MLQSTSSEASAQRGTTRRRIPVLLRRTCDKERAYQALVYLHRYHEGTLARMRMEYVVPLWQDGYGVVTLRKAEVSKVGAYVAEQEEIHAKRQTSRTLETRSVEANAPAI